MRFAVGITVGLALVAGVPASAQDFDWHISKNRMLIAGALNHWGDFCSATFYFDQKPKRTNAELEPKVNSYLLLSATPSVEVQKWGEWLPYANPDSDVAKPTQNRAADALLAARADPSAAAAAEKLYLDTMRDYFHTVFSKCQEGAHDSFIAANLYTGDGDFDRAMQAVKIDFAKDVKDLDKPAPRKPTSRSHK